VQAPEPAVEYSSYLRVPELLALQNPRSSGPEHDGLLFIKVLVGKVDILETMTPLQLMSFRERL